MASKFYNNGLLLVANGGIDVVNDSIRLALVPVGYTFLKTHTVRSSLTELTVTNYAPVVLANKTLAIAADLIVFDNTADLTFTSLGAGETAVAGVFYKHVDGVAANDLLMSYNDGLSIATDGNNVVVTIGANGVWRLNPNQV